MRTVSTRRGIAAKMWKYRWCYLGLLPAIGLLLLFNLYPAVDAIVKSLYRWKSKNYYAPVFDGLSNYKKLLEDKEFWGSFGTMLAFIVAGGLTTYCVNMPVTYLVYRLGEGRTGRFFQRAMIIPMMIPGMVFTMYWRFFFAQTDGVLNSILQMLGYAGKTPWLGQNSTALICILFMGFPWLGGFAFLLFLSGFQHIDRELHDAARVDGATGLVRFLRIDVPLIIPEMKMLSVLGMISSIHSYAGPMVMTNGRYGTMVPGLHMYQTAFSFGNYGKAAAMGVVLFVLTMLITVLQNKYINRLD